jgi:hypothetical protein
LSLVTITDFFFSKGPSLADCTIGGRTKGDIRMHDQISADHIFHIFFMFRTLPLDDFKRFLYCGKYGIITLINQRLLKCQQCLVCRMGNRSSLERNYIDNWTTSNLLDLDGVIFPLGKIGVLQLQLGSRWIAGAKDERIPLHR